VVEIVAACANKPLLAKGKGQKAKAVTRQGNKEARKFLQSVVAVV